MLRNYLKSAWRNISRSKVNSVLNIAGLSIGVACVLLIALYINDEFRFDRFYAHDNRIFQVNMDANFGGQKYVASGTPPPVGAALQTAFPDIASFTRTYQLGNQVVSTEDGGPNKQQFTERRMFGADSNYLQIFNYAFREGNAASCLQSPHSIVLTEASAIKYFGSPHAAMGKRLTLDQFRTPLVVTAVLENVPAQSSFQFDMLVSMADCWPVRRFSWSWVWCQMTTFVVLGDRARLDEAGVKALQQKFPAMVRQQAASAFNRIGQPFDEFIKKGGKWDFLLQPIARIHLYSTSMGTSYTNLGDITYVYIFAAIALFIIILACVNFMNLATAQSARRAKEVGIRKVLGSLRGQLIRQFLAEAMLYSFLSTIVALILVGFLLPSFNQLSGKTLPFSDIFCSPVVIFVLTLPVLTGFLAGIYPAFYLTSFHPAAVLKGVGLLRKGKDRLNMRNGLVVFQFTVSISLIICTLVVFQQLRFALHRDLGLTKDNIVVLPNAEKMKPGAQEALRQALLQTPGVTDASIASDVPGVNFYGFTDFYVPGLAGVKEPLAKDLTLTSIIVDEHYIPTLHMQVLKGRNFSKAFSDSNAVILNESAVKQAGWKDPLGKIVLYPGNDNQAFKVVGVVKDFGVQSVRSVVTPFALFPFSATSQGYSSGTAYLVISVHSADPQRVISSFEQTWKRLAPEVPFAYSFLDKDFEALYRSEQRMGTVFGIFTGLSILVACLGLLGLTIYTAERRTKEVGVRKVLGASVQSLVLLLSKDFLVLVLIAAVVAFPIAWWAMNKWLTDYAYRIDIPWWVFLVSGMMALLIAVCTMSFQAVKAASANPIKSLRTE